MLPKDMCTLLTVDMYTNKHPKIFQSSLSCYDGVDKQKRIAVIALHKCGIERAYIFELLEPLNNMHVFVYHTLKLF